MRIKERVKYAAKKLNISVAQVERDCDLTRSSIDKWDRNIPGADKLRKVADYLGVTMDWLCSDTGSTPTFTPESVEALGKRVQNWTNQKGYPPRLIEQVLNWRCGSVESFKTRIPAIEELIAVSQEVNMPIDALIYNIRMDEVLGLLTSQEENLLRLFRSVNEQGQKQILKQARYATEESEYKKRDTLSGEVVDGE